jgi:hypothetical protein
LGKASRAVRKSLTSDADAKFIFQEVRNASGAV